MVGRLVEHDEVRRVEGGEPEQQPRLLAAGEIGDRRVGMGAGKADGAGAGTDLRLRRVGHQLAHMVGGAGRGIELVELVLGEIGDPDPVRARHLAGERREASGQKLGQRRLAVAVGAEERDAVVGIDPQGEPPQHRACRLVADRHLVDGEDRRRKRLVGGGDGDPAHVVLDAHVDRLQLGEQLHPRLGLARFRRLGAESLDESGEALALGLLALGEAEIKRQPLVALALERGVVATIEGEPIALEMQDRVRLRNRGDRGRG